jgi:hypothetical protein
MKLMRSIALSVLALIASFAATDQAIAQAVPQLGYTSVGSDTSFVAGRFVANNYAYTGAQLYTGNAATGAASVTVRGGYVVLPDSRNVVPFAVGVPIIVMDSAPELVTPTAVSGCYNSRGGNQDGVLVTCTITATFAAVHGAGAQVFSGTNGLAEAILDAFNWGGGVVAIAPGWSLGLNTSCTACFASKSAAIAGVLPYQLVTLEDDSVSPPQLYTPASTVATILAAPATLLSTTAGFGVASANFTGGTYTGSSTYITCIAYVDIMGNEGPCSATFTIATSGSAATDQIGYTAPAASAGAVGYTIYISLAGGTYNLTYQVPLTSTVCTLTKIETVTPACALANTTYNQTGSTAIVSALTVNTAPLHLLATTASTTSAYIGAPSGRTAYAYAPTGTLNSGLTSTQQAYTVAAATATTVPGVIATIPVPIGSMNTVGRTLCIAGQATEASAGSTATVQNIEFLWDAAGSDTAGAPVIIGQEQLTATLVTANADFWNFQGCFQTTVAGAGVTAGTVRDIDGRIVSIYGAGVLGNVGTDVLGAVGSLNLAGTGGNTQRIHVVWLHTTNTDAPACK